MEEKNYYSLNKFYREKFSSKVFKISLDANFSCPNRDGTIGYGGCIFCNGTPFIGNKDEDLLAQFNNIKNLLHKKWKEAKYIVYLEAGSNTYAPLETLKKIYEPLIEQDNVVGINTGTRPDCLSRELLDYLEKLNTKTFVTIELGLQSSNEDTLKLINRGHDLQTFTKAVTNLHSKKINVVAHIINGLPYEDKKTMIETVKYLNNINIDGIKIHMLYIEKDTLLEKMYEREKFHILTKEEYIDILGEQISILNPNIVIHRLFSGPPRDTLLEPKWLLHKFTLLNEIDKYLKEKDIYQGKKRN